MDDTSIKNIRRYTNEAIYKDYNNKGVIQELNQIRTQTINGFSQTIPFTRMLVSLCLIDNIILNIYDNEIEIIIKIVHELRENILYLFSFGQTVQNTNSDDNDDDED